MRIGNLDISWSAWLGSKWTMYATRLVILTIPFVGTAFWAAWSGVQTVAVTDVAAVKADVAAVKAAVVVRGNDSESFQVEVRKLVSEVNAKVDDLSDDMFSTKVDVGVIKRLVTELRDQQVNAAARLDPAAFGGPVVMAAVQPRTAPPEPFPALTR